MNALAEIIAGEIRSKGVISFARFMELALYCPVYGYYEREQDSLGRAGDFYTSVSVGSLFGQLLAAQFADWLGELDSPEALGPSSGAAAGKPVCLSPCPGAAPEADENVCAPPQGQDRAVSATGLLTIVEAGAHDGRLAADILGWLRRRRPALLARLHYCIAEPSERRRAWQQRRLAEFSGTVRWVGGLAELPGVRGIIFSNEMLDAMPVHGFRWKARERAWVELGVTIEDGSFTWTEMAPNSAGPSLAPRPSPLDCPEALLAVLPDGFTIEVGLAARAWWREAAGVLVQGRLVTIDYGMSSEQFLAPERRDGTLRAYARHRQSGDVLANPGTQDITAHVDFSAIRAAGEAAGLQTEAFLTQEEFFTRIAARIWQGQTDFDPWTPRCSRQFRTLTHPQLLGRPFRVLVQRCGGVVLH